MGIRTAPPNLIRNGEEKLSSIDLGDCYWVDHTWLFGTTWHGFQDINNILNAGEAGSNDLVDSKMAFRHWLWMTMAVFVRVLHWSTRDAKLKIIPIPEAPLEQGVTTNCGMLSVQQMKTETGSVVCGTKTLVKKDEKWHSTPSVPCFPVFFFCIVSSHSQFQKGAESLPQRRDWQGHCRHTATEPRAALFHGLFGMMVLLGFGRWTCWNSSSLSRATSSWQQHSSWQAAEKLMLHPQCGSELLNLTSSQTTEVLPSWPTSWFQSVLFRGLVSCKIDSIVWYIYIYSWYFIFDDQLFLRMLGFLGVELLFQSPIVGDPCVGSRKSPWLMACCDPPPSWWGLRGSGRTWMNSNGENSNSPRHITRTSPCASTDPWAVSTTWDVFFRPLFFFPFC